MFKIFDKIINYLRWPIALMLLFSIPALIKSYEYFDFSTRRFFYFSLGIAFFIFTFLACGYKARQDMQVISHELTHVLFAYLTLHIVGGVRLHPDSSGGSMEIKGHGNWIISLAPYFFPLFSFLFMILMPFLLRAFENNWVIFAIFGYFFGYYWSTVLSQVHLKQTDIIREGYLFSAIIIVTLNIYITGVIFAFNSKLWYGVRLYLENVHLLNKEYLNNLILQYF